jgi:hypothetical protein
VELEGDDGLVVTFSDGTTAGYIVDELLELRPHREPVEKSSRMDQMDSMEKVHGIPADRVAARR